MSDLMRHSLDFVSRKDRKPVAGALKNIYRVRRRRRRSGNRRLRGRYLGAPLSGHRQSWRRAWSEVVPFYAFPFDVRRILYTTDEIDKRFMRGRPRGEARCIGCKRRRAAYSSLARIEAPAKCS
ncbi:transposase [Aquibium sp. LZ166]|uniref:Transposase n=1 Tax=Aquibium pacificus TaxID=3153579 RepID=A0ABV3STL5_9HYPH